MKLYQPEQEDIDILHAAVRLSTASGIGFDAAVSALTHIMASKTSAADLQKLFRPRPLRVVFNVIVWFFAAWGVLSMILLLRGLWCSL